MLRRRLLRSRIAIAVLILAAAIAGTVTATATGAASAPKAPALPSPLRFVSNLDLECFRTDPYVPPLLPEPITLTHLNPELAEQARWRVDRLGERSQLCSPVAKNSSIPPDEVLRFIMFVDLACYRIDGPSLNRRLVLSQLNPVLADLPRRTVAALEPEQLCVPVIKNDSVPPDEVLKFVSFIDLVCYREAPQALMEKKLRLTQLNPELREIPQTTVRVDLNRQLCVPVRKNDQQIPDEVLKILQWIDLEKWDITPAATPPLPSVGLKLRHINPLLEHLPTEPAKLVARWQLALPVAKNGNIPPA